MCIVHSYLYVLCICVVYLCGNVSECVSPHPLEILPLNLVNPRVYGTPYLV